jgi:type II secretory pathway pseudopilin PulG
MRNTPHSGGFTLLEIIMALSLGVTAMIVIGSFGADLANFGLFFGDSLQVEQELQLTFKLFNSELLAMQTSHRGDYPLVKASSNEIQFYSDVDGDGLIDEVRYFVDGRILKKGVIKPNGTPLNYDPTQEIVTEPIYDLVPSASGVFSYYNKDYTGGEPAMVQPLDIKAVRVVRSEVLADKNPQAEPGPTRYLMMITIRNLRSNI